MQRERKSTSAARNRCAGNAIDWSRGSQGKIIAVVAGVDKEGKNALSEGGMWSGPIPTHPRRNPIERYSH